MLLLPLLLLLLTLLLLLLLTLLLLLGSRQAELRQVDRSERTQRQARVVDLWKTGRRSHVEFEVDPDSFEESIADRDEANFDGHLQILQSTQLIEQVCDLFVNLLSLADHQAQCRFM